MSTFETITIQSKDNVLTITLNRPQAYNAYNDAMSAELAAAFRTAARDDGVRAIVLTGAGKAFCSGQDLGEIRGRYETSPGGAGQRPAPPAPSSGTGAGRYAPLPAPPAPSSGTGAGRYAPLDFGTHLRKKYNGLIQRIRTLEKPVIAAVNGVAAGAGVSFALACDLRIAARSASFMMAFGNIGLIPDSGATLTLVQHIGYSRAAELCLLGEKLPAERAYAWGLVNRLSDDERLPADAQALAARLAALPTRGLGLTKRALNKAWTATLDEQLEYEAFLQATAGATADHREGVLAFLQKREPRFRGE